MAQARILLLSDVIDSTKLTEQVGDARMADIWMAHDRLARDLLLQWNGQEIDRTDGFLMLFTRVAEAANYGAELHKRMRTLSSELGIEMKLRIGIHRGEVILIETSEEDRIRGAKPIEVEGLAKPTAARVMSVATGGQTLMSSTAMKALGSTELKTRSHGHWRLKGVEEPIELFEIGVDQSIFHPPPDAEKVYRVVKDDDLWIPLREVRNNLPAERDSFIGRNQDLHTLAQLVSDEVSLVTVTGPGGTGKTRLIRRFGWTWLGDFPGGVWFCDLSEARSLEGIELAVARALDIPLGKDDPIQQLGNALLGRGRCLLLLDNFEQVTSFAHKTLGHWLDRAPDCMFIVSSRNMLNLQGEHVLSLEPLPVNTDALALFEARASARKHFQITDENREDVQTIVAMLDGLPLAIELAAARISVLAPAQLRERLKDRFRLLAGSKTAAARQATLKAAIDWSWDLLEEWEKSAMAQCSAFQGGFTLEAAEEVLDLSAWPDAPWPMDVVQALVEKSLIRSLADRREIDEPYFGMYVSIQAYAAEKLAQENSFEGSGPDGEQAVWTRHGRYYGRNGTDAAIESLFAHDGVSLRQALAVEIDNLITGCSRAIDRNDPDVAVALLRAAWAVLELNGPFTSGINLASAVLKIPGLGDARKGWAEYVAASANWRAAKIEVARKHCEVALEEARSVLDSKLEGIVLGIAGALNSQQGKTEEARVHLEDALELARLVRNPRYEDILCNLGVIDIQQGRMDDAGSHFEAALEMTREFGHRSFEGIANGNLAVLHHQQLHSELAMKHYQAALEIAREVGDRRSEGITLGNLSDLHLTAGDMEEAQRCYESALALAREVGDRRVEGIWLGYLGIFFTKAGYMEKGLEHIEGGIQILREVGDRLNVAKLLADRAEIDFESGEDDTARAALKEAEQLAEVIGAGPESELGKKIAETRMRIG